MNLLLIAQVQQRGMGKNEDGSACGSQTTTYCPCSPAKGMCTRHYYSWHRGDQLDRTRSRSRDRSPDEPRAAPRRGDAAE